MQIAAIPKNTQPFFGKYTDCSFLFRNIPSKHQDPMQEKTKPSISFAENGVLVADNSKQECGNASTRSHSVKIISCSLQVHFAHDSLKDCGKQVKCCILQLYLDGDMKPLLDTVFA